MMEKIMKIRMLATCVALILSVAVICSCGAGLPVVRLDSETEKKISTMTLGEDSFTLPCGMDEFLEKGYTLSCYEKEVDIYGILVPGRTEMSGLTVSKDGKKPIRIGVVNTDSETKPLGECQVIEIRYLYDDYRVERDCSTDWKYMGITAGSNHADVIAAFSGILELKIDDPDLKDNCNYIAHEDIRRDINFFYIRGDTGTYYIDDMSVKILPEDMTWDDIISRRIVQ